LKLIRPKKQDESGRHKKFTRELAGDGSGVGRTAVIPCKAFIICCKRLMT
jgi:hypothetical protein